MVNSDQIVLNVMTKYKYPENINITKNCGPIIFSCFQIYKNMVIEFNYWISSLYLKGFVAALLWRQLSNTNMIWWICHIMILSHQIYCWRKSQSSLHPWPMVYTSLSGTYATNALYMDGATCSMVWWPNSRKMARYHYLHQIGSR